MTAGDSSLFPPRRTAEDSSTSAPIVPHRSSVKISPELMGTWDQTISLPPTSPQNCFPKHTRRRYVCTYVAEGLWVQHYSRASAGERQVWWAVRGRSAWQSPCLIICNGINFRASGGGRQVGRTVRNKVGVTVSLLDMQRRQFLPG